MPPLILIAIIFVLNLPFGMWRATTKRFSLGWFISIHLPVIAAIVLRLTSGIGFHLVVLLQSAAAFLLGQFGGGWIYRLSKGTS